MRFKQFIVEKAMHMRTFSDVKSRLGSEAKVGFEFEMVIPEHSELHSEPLSGDRSTQIISFYDTLDEFEEMFEMPRTLKNMIAGDYDDWVEQQKKDLGDSFDSDKAEFRDWLHAEFSNNLDFVDTYGLVPSYGWYDESARYASIFTEPAQEHHEVSGTMEEVRRSLNDVFNTPVIVHDSYHGTKKDSTSWYVEPDSTIKGEGHGVEIVSPPLTLNEALAALEKMFGWMDKVKARTNETTGLHINISVPNIQERLDPVKLILFMGEDYAAGQFGRKGNKYTASQREVIISKVKMSGKLPQTAADMIKAAKKFLAQDKYYSVNLGNLDNGYLEFRVAGGEGYESNTDKVKKTIYRLITAVEIACSPALEQKEYLKKLVALFDQAGDEMLDVNRNDMDLLPKDIQRFYRFDSAIKGLYFEYVALKHPTDKREALVLLLQHVVKAAENFKTHVDLSERVFFKKLIKECGLQSSDVDAHIPYPQDRLRFKKEIGL